jgi:hypothetical protein
VGSGGLPNPTFNFSGISKSFMSAGFILAIRIASALLVLLVLIAALRGELGHHYRQHFANERRERLFLAALAFLMTMFGLRALTWAIHHHIGPMHDIQTRSFHLHHMVWGILGLLVIGYLWLAQLWHGNVRQFAMGVCRHGGAVRNLCRSHFGRICPLAAPSRRVLASTRTPEH